MTKSVLPHKLSVVWMMSLLLAGCSFAPDYEVPKVDDAGQYKENVGAWNEVQPTDDIKRGDWWTVFGDTKLNELENELTGANQTLKSALAQYEQARLQASVARTAYFPTITGNTSGVRTKDSLKLANTPTVTQFNTFAAQGDFSYELDLWGRVRNTVEANQDQAEASAADLENVRLSLHAELAIDYIALCVDDEAAEILQQIVHVDEKALRLSQDRYKGGAVAEVEVDDAENKLENAKAQLSDIDLQRSQLEHAVAVLTGKNPSGFTLSHQAMRLHVPHVKADLPSQLLQRRPDIAAAERRVAAANAEIGVARAAFFPTFSLTGAGGYENKMTGGWFTAPASFWSFGPSASVNLFDAGRLSDLSDEARAAYEQSAAQYRQVVLMAYQDVEDNLATQHYLFDEARSQASALKSTEKSMAHALDLYHGGATTYLDVVSAQNAQLQARLTNLLLLARRLTASVELIKALGGGTTS
ncbi:MAG: efflux transporter outer membrane subunit [Alphaproteobacteria bacterium]|nr:efflux transporter outer membrane subunit [Alphaproteobacteria bacterium]